jgi:polyisoprenoid-binding protein YceI
MKAVAHILSFIACFVAPSVFAQGTSKILADQKQSTVSYDMEHPLHQWTGVSKKASCVILFNRELSTITSVAVSIPLNSFDSKNSNRDSHGLEVLEAIQFPNVKFSASSITQEQDELTITGNLTFHNKTKLVTVKAKRTNLKNEILIDGNFLVNLNDYEIPVPSLMGLKTKEEITIHLHFVFALSGK